MITSHRSIFAVWCCALRSTCDLVIGLTVNECVSVCVCLFVLQAWLCLIALGVSCLDPTTGRGNDTTILIEQQPEFDSWIQRVSECDVHFKKRCSCERPSTTDLRFFISVTNNSVQFDFVTCLQVWGQFLQINFTEWDGRQKDCRGFCIILHYFSISQQSLSIF